MTSFSLQECRKLAELASASCMADFYRAAPPAFAEAHGLYLEQTASFTATLAKNSRDFGMYNRVFALGVAQPTTEGEVDHVVNLYGQAHLSFLVRLSPDAQPPELLHWLDVRGLTLVQESTSARFYLRPAESISLRHPFQIRSVGRSEAADFAQIACLDHSPALQTWLLATIGRPWMASLPRLCGEHPGGKRCALHAGRHRLARVGGDAACLSSQRSTTGVARSSNQRGHPYGMCVSERGNPGRDSRAAQSLVSQPAASRVSPSLSPSALPL